MMLDVVAWCHSIHRSVSSFPATAARVFTLVGEDRTFLLCLIWVKVSVAVFPQCVVRGLPSGHRHRHITKWACLYLDILLLSTCTVRLSIGHRVCTEDAWTGVRLECRKSKRWQLGWELWAPRSGNSTAGRSWAGASACMFHLTDMN